MRQIFPAPAAGQLSEPAAGPAGEAALTALAALYRYPETGEQASRPWVRANMISSADGAATVDGRSGGLAGSADRAVFSVLRSLSDVILVGAGTARIEQYRPVQLAEAWPELRAGRPPAPPIAVVTRQLTGLDPDGPLLTTEPGRARTIVFTTEAAPAGLRAQAAQVADVIVAGSDLVQPDAIISALAERGYRRVLTEGGPRLLAQIVAAGLLDELCLTVSPVLAGGWAGRIVTAPPPAGARAGLPAQLGPADLRLAHVLEDGGHLLCRYLRTEAD